MMDHLGYLSGSFVLRIHKLLKVEHTHTHREIHRYTYTQQFGICNVYKSVKNNFLFYVEQVKGIY